MKERTRPKKILEGFALILRQDSLKAHGSSEAQHGYLPVKISPNKSRSALELLRSVMLLYIGGENVRENFGSR